MSAVSHEHVVSSFPVATSTTIITINDVQDMHLLQQHLAAGVSHITCHVMPHVQFRAHLHSNPSWAKSLEITWIMHAYASISIDWFIDHEQLNTVVCSIELIEPGAECHVSVHAGVAPQKTFDIRTAQRHFVRATQSTVLVKTLVGAQAHSIYHGTITVEKEAHGSRARQLNKNCLLSDQSHARSFPALEALTDDVSCAHGSATGPINSEHIWFLTTRGYTQEQARAMLLRAFLSQGLQDETTCVHATDTVSTQCIKLSLDRLIALSQGTL